MAFQFWQVSHLPVWMASVTAGEVVQAVMPNPLPPAPPLAWSPSLRALHNMEHLVGLGIAREVAGGRRNRLFAHAAYLAILSEGGEPLG